jgi:hypothetical protein
MEGYSQLSNHGTVNIAYSGVDLSSHSNDNGRPRQGIDCNLRGGARAPMPHSWRRHWSRRSILLGNGVNFSHPVGK